MLGFLISSCLFVSSFSLKVEFDSRSFLLDGKREMFVGGCIHYPRSHYTEWPHIFSEAKAQGINLIETYVFWDIHEQVQGEYYFPTEPSSANLVEFIREAQKQSLYVHLRFGPYVCAEWNYGGLPVWLREMGNGTSVFRTTDKYWMSAMTSFIDKVIEVVTDAKLFAADGGPIVMVQIENEYGNIEAAYGQEGADYIAEVSEYALSKHVDVPWIMCQQGEGVGTAPPAEIINTCNGHYCDNWISQHTKAFPNQPHMWTENWPGWFQKWGEPVPHRPATDVSFAVARWFARGGSFLSYYMAFGGSNFGRSVGGPQIVTSYDYDVQINEYGLRNEPKYSLLQQLHDIILTNKDTLLNQMPPTPLSFNSNCEVHVYSDDNNCVVFLSNWDTKQNCEINYSSDEVAINSESVLPWSVTIMQGSGADSCHQLKAIYNTKSSVSTAQPENRLIGIPFDEVIFEKVSVVQETVPSKNVPTIQSTYPLEQLSVTKDSTDYLWYSTQIESQSTTGRLSYVTGGAGGDVIYVFVNKQLQTSSIEQTVYHQHLLQNSHLKSTPISFDLEVPVGKSSLDILSVSMGLNNYGAFLEQNEVGVISNITFNSQVLTQFTHSIGLTGELPSQIKPIERSDDTCSSLCWFTLQFNTPLSYQPPSDGLSTIALDLGGSNLRKGSLSVNGQMIGRYWTIIASKENSGIDCQVCEEESYSGSYSGSNCRRGCGEMSQRYYKIPAQFLYDASSGKKNELVVFDEYNGTPEGIQLVNMKMTESF